MILKYSDPEDYAKLNQQVLKGLEGPLRSFNQLIADARGLGVDLQLFAMKDSDGRQWIRVGVRQD